MTSRTRRGAAVYMTVLAVAMVAGLLAITAVTLRRIERRRVAGDEEIVRARLNARAAVEVGRLRLRDDPDWRTTYSSGTWEFDVAVAGGSYTLEGIDPVDGDLADDSTEPLLLIGTGYAGRAVQKVQLRLEPDPQPLDSLATVATSGDWMVVNSFGGVVTASGAPLVANGTFQNFGLVNADVEAANDSGPGTFSGTLDLSAPPRRLPDPTDALAYYLANGTPIDFATLPSQEIRQVVLGPTSNPYGGTTNPEGIYVVDCQGNDIVIRECRIDGTIVLVNAGWNSVAREQVTWRPAVANYPALLVDGDFEIAIDASLPLTEENISNVNLNPPGAPYRGLADSDTVDTYPTRIEGLVYVTGNLWIQSQPEIAGVLLAGNMLQTYNNALLTVKYRDTFFNAPPPGFLDWSRMRPVAGGWRKVVD